MARSLRVSVPSMEAGGDPRSTPLSFGVAQLTDLRYQLVCMVRKARQLLSRREKEEHKVGEGGDGTGERHGEDRENWTVNDSGRIPDVNAPSSCWWWCCGAVPGVCQAVVRLPAAHPGGHPGPQEGRHRHRVSSSHGSRREEKGVHHSYMLACLVSAEREGELQTEVVIGEQEVAVLEEALELKKKQLEGQKVREATTRPRVHPARRTR